MQPLRATQPRVTPSSRNVNLRGLSGRRGMTKAVLWASCGCVLRRRRKRGTSESFIDGITIAGYPLRARFGDDAMWGPGAMPLDDLPTVGENTCTTSKAASSSDIVDSKHKRAERTTRGSTGGARHKKRRASRSRSRR